ncbi:hypothetical protein [Microbispora sp. NPDC046933]|uniref:hypothetical protein n=1 Tax=Microbispora sp. NPDC046933 TaxID=3155618 RepID=UPI0033EA6D72
MEKTTTWPVAAWASDVRAYLEAARVADHLHGGPAEWLATARQAFAVLERRRLHPLRPREDIGRYFVRTVYSAGIDLTGLAAHLIREGAGEGPGTECVASARERGQAVECVVDLTPGRGALDALELLGDASAAWFLRQSHANRVPCGVQPAGVIALPSSPWGRSPPVPDQQE